MKHTFIPVGKSCMIGRIQVGPGPFITDDPWIVQTLQNSKMNGQWFYETPNLEDVKASLVPASVTAVDYEEPIAITPVDGVSNMKAEEDAVKANLDALIEDIQRDLDIEQAKLDKKKATIPNPKKGEEEALDARQKRLDAKQAALDAGDLEVFDNTPKKKPGRPKKAAAKKK